MSSESIKEKTYIYLNEKGLIEHIDEETGRIVLIQKTVDDSIFKDKSRTIPYTSTDGKQCRIERGLEHLGLMVTKRWVCNETLTHIICQQITEGKSLLELCKRTEPMGGEKLVPPYYIIARWRREKPEFDLKIKQAMKDRAEILYGKALEEAEKADEDTATAAKIFVDTLKWGAQVDDSDKFGTKTKVSGDSDAPITFIINTGIVRTQLPEPVKEAQPVIETTAIEAGDTYEA